MKEYRIFTENITVKLINMKTKKEKKMDMGLREVRSDLVIFLKSCLQASVSVSVLPP